MAEYVERKFTAAKLSVALAVAALLGGMAARDSSAGAAAADPAAKGAEPHLSEGSITTAQIKDGSLLFEDFKAGEIYSKHQANDQFLKVKDAKEKWLKIKDANKTFIKGEDANKTFLKVEDANNTFVKGEDANRTFVKIEDAQHQFVNGDGKVITGFEASNGGAVVTVFEVAGLVRAQGVPTVAGGAQPHLRLTNLGGTPLHFGTGGGEGVIAPGASADVNLPQGGGAGTVQLVNEESTPTVGTLTVSAIPIGQATNFSGQILIGMSQ